LKSVVTHANHFSNNRQSSDHLPSRNHN
jgi:hypothetical protein